MRPKTNERGTRKGEKFGKAGGGRKIWRLIEKKKLKRTGKSSA